LQNIITHSNICLYNKSLLPSRLGDIIGDIIAYQMGYTSRFEAFELIKAIFGTNNCSTGGGLFKSFDVNPNTIIQAKIYEFKALTNS
jgi:hypothetical protein